MLDLDDAERLLALCQAQIEAYSDPLTKIDDAGLELLAESLSGLGFYVDAVLQNRPDREHLIAPLIARRLGEDVQPAPADRQSVEHSVIELRAALPRLVADVRDAPADGAVRAELRGKLANLRDDAELIGDTELAAQADAALREIDAGAADAAVAKSVDLIVETGAAPAPVISDETRRLLATDAGALDAELLDIYLTEADEVLDTVHDGYQTLTHNSSDREALATVRRQFHTLKGSGRMVGLTELGELAWAVERVHNRVLEDDRRVTPALIALIRTALASFRQWVRELRETGRIATEPAQLQAALSAIASELPGFAPLPALMEAKAAPQSAPAAGSETAPARDAEIIDLPEFGAPVADGAAPVVTSTEASVEVTIEIGLPSDGRDSHKPMLRIVADNTAAHAAAADARARLSPHAPGLTLLTDGSHADVGQTEVGQDADATEAAETPGGGAEAELGNVAIGSITLSAALWSILCDEAEQNVAILQHEVSLMQFDPDHPPIAAMVRASHTLCGIHRTGGIAVIAEVAQSLEQTLLALEQHGSPFPGGAHPVLARASAGVAHLVGRVRAREAFSAGDEREAADIGVELDELRQEATANAPALDLLLGDDDLDRVQSGPIPGAAARSPAESGGGSRSRLAVAGDSELLALPNPRLPIRRGRRIRSPAAPQQPRIGSLGTRGRRTGFGNECAYRYGGSRVR